MTMDWSLNSNWNWFSLKMGLMLNLFKSRNLLPPLLSSSLV